MRFIMIYLVGFAIMFQLPVVVLLINNISPLRPMKLLSYTGYVVLGSFIAAAILTPTPDPVNQTIMAGVPIVLYLVSILLIALGRVRWKSLLIWKRPRGRSELLPNGKPLT
jgi:sec-independent protein translocase protein TatC